MRNEGWICPRCDVVNAPHISQCGCKYAPGIWPDWNVPKTVEYPDYPPGVGPCWWKTKGNPIKTGDTIESITGPTCSDSAAPAMCTASRMGMTNQPPITGWTTSNVPC